MMFLSKISHKSFVFYLLLFLQIPLSAQNNDKPEPKSYTAPDGTLYWNRNMPVYIRLANSPTDTGQLVKQKTQNDVKPYFFDNEGANQIRTRWATDSEGNKISPPKEVVWEVFADGKAPLTKADFDSDTEFLLPDSKSYTRFYGSDLAIKINAEDELSGTESTKYSINGLPFAEYTSPLTINREGDYSLEFYSSDKVGNLEEKKTINFKLDLSPPVTEHQISGRTFNGIFSADTKIILDADDTGAGVAASYYSIDGGEARKFNGSNIELTDIENGEHTISYYSEDNVKNKEKSKSFDFYLDKMAPILTSTIIGDQYVKDGKIYFSGRSKLKLTAADDKAGLEEIQYSLNGKEFVSYTEPFYLPGRSGLHTVKYFAADSMGNKTATQRLIDAKYENQIFSHEEIYADIVPPSLEFDLIGKSFKARDTLFLGKNTSIRFKGNDNGSGFNRILYTFDGAPDKETYTLPFSLVGLRAGSHTLEFTGYDNVNNKTHKKIVFVLDNTPPDLHYFFSVAPYAKEDGYDVYPPYASVYLAASDRTTGAKNVRYTINGSEEKIYKGSISGFSVGKLNKIIIKSSDELGNDREIEIEFYVK